MILWLSPTTPKPDSSCGRIGQLWVTGLNNEAVAVDIERRLAFVAGWVRWVPGTGNREAFLVRAYDTKTGNLDWED